MFEQLSNQRKEQILSFDEKNYTICGCVKKGNAWFLKIKHSLCGKNYESRIDKFLDAKQRCSCERKNKNLKFKNKDELQDFLNKKTKNEYKIMTEFYMSHQPITILHKKCGYKYEIKRAEYIFAHDSFKAKCPICNNRTKNSVEKLNFKFNRLNINCEIFGEYKTGCKKINIKNNNCGHVYEKYLSDISKNYHLINLCPICSKYGQSSYETMIYDFLKSFYDGVIIKKYRSNNKEIDVYLPELKIGFEINGLYWHSNHFIDDDYHINKISFFKNRGIYILNIYEDLFFDKELFENVKLYIKNLITKKYKQISEKTYLRQISYDDFVEYSNKKRLFFSSIYNDNFNYKYLYDENENIICCFAEKNNIVYELHFDVNYSICDIIHELKKFYNTFLLSSNVDYFKLNQNIEIKYYKVFELINNYHKAIPIEKTAQPLKNYICDSGYFELTYKSI